jgi:hypothetical protein
VFTAIKDRAGMADGPLLADETTSYDRDAG